MWKKTRTWLGLALAVAVGVVVIVLLAYYQVGDKSSTMTAAERQQAMQHLPATLQERVSRDEH